MSPIRIGSMGLFVLTMRAVEDCSPTCVSSIIPFGFSLGMPGEAESKIDIFSLGCAPWRRVMSMTTSRRS